MNQDSTSVSTSATNDDSLSMNGKNIHNSTSITPNSNSSVNNKSKAEDLIRSLDNAVAKMTSYAKNAADDVQEAERNALAAQQVAKKYRSSSFLVNGKIQGKRVDEVGSLGSMSGMINGDVGGVGAMTDDTPPTSNTSVLHQMKDQIDSSTDRLVESHAEDVLALSLQIENLKLQLQTEAATKSKLLHDLKDEQMKSTSLEKELQCLKVEIEKSKDDSIKVKVLESELTQARIRVEAAEEDALQALDLAKNSDERRKETEIMFQNVLSELDQVRKANHHLPVIEEGADGDDAEQDEVVIDKDVAVADAKGEQQELRESLKSNKSLVTPTKSRLQRPALVAAGRDLLRNKSGSDDSSACSSLDGSVVSAASTSSWLDLTRKSAEKRRKLKDRINRSNSREMTGRHISFDSNAENSSGRATKHDNVKSKSSLVCQKVGLLLRHSGKRLNLKGRWFRPSSSTSMKPPASASSSSERLGEAEIESMAKNYCQSVEVHISRLQEEKKDLESLCNFLEQKLVKD